MDFPNELMSTWTRQADSQYSVNICGTDMNMKAGTMLIDLWIHYMTEHIVGYP